ncbi:MAG TPA: mechanosensitive ion channel family protein [Longimicrobiales bacterium]|nr:mechanosensitive ion channel family protein [Longimicrobiales bacterium]
MIQVPDSTTTIRLPVAVTEWFAANPVFGPLAGLAALALVAWLAAVVVRHWLLGLIGRVVSRTRFTWDDALQEHRVFARVSLIAPAAIVYYGLPLIPGLPGAAVLVGQRVAAASTILFVALALTAIAGAANDIYARRPDAQSRPIKGYLQVVNIFVFIVAAALIVARLIDRSPVVFLSGIGALTAVILLIFRDTILSLVASVQLAANDMVRIGDWIEVPKYGADGDVVDVALHTIKVQNWDKTITTIPTHALISDSFKNWRGMSEAGGRRIKRALAIDMNSVGFLEEDDIERLGSWELLHDYVSERVEAVESFNRQREVPEGVIPHRRRLTNLGTFRAYVLAYLRARPDVHQDMTLLVRQLAPTEAGLPLEIYVFTRDTAWAVYEGIQADIMDHLLSVLPEFGLRVFQGPAGADVRALGGPAPDARDTAPGVVGGEATDAGGEAAGVG